MIRKTAISSLLLLFSSLLFGYHSCLNKCPISDECAISIFARGDYRTFLSHEKEVVFEGKNQARLYRIFALFEVAQYGRMDSEISKLDGKTRSSLVVRYIKMRADFARKRFSGALALYGELEDEMPEFLKSSSLGCMEADILLYRKKYEEALGAYDLCLKEGSNDVAAFNSLLAREHGRGANGEHLESYLKFMERYHYSELAAGVRERLLRLKREKKIPGKDSVFFGRWLGVMRRMGEIDSFYDDTLLDVEGPADLEIISYLQQKGLYRKAMDMVEKRLEKGKDQSVLYGYGWKKFKILEQSGKVSESADYLATIAESLSGVRRERANFFASLNYFEAGRTEEARTVLEAMVFREKRSKYWLLALYKLGLIHLYEGNDTYAFALWSNMLYDRKINPARYYSGRSVMRTMLDMTAMMDRMSNSCILGEHFDAIDGENGDDNGVLSFYDVLYAHIFSEGSFEKKAEPGNFKSDRRSLWKKNLEKSSEDPYLLIRKKLPSFTKKEMKKEYLGMIDLFSRFKIRDGLLFYADFVASRLKEDVDGDEKILLRKISKELLGPIYRLADVPGKRIDHTFPYVRKSLGTSPMNGDREVWKVLYPTPYFDSVLRLTEEFDVDPATIYSIMRAETLYRSHLVSHVGAIGIMQIMPYTFEKIAARSGIRIKDPFDPYQSMKASAWYLDRLLKRFDGNLLLAAAAYNAGPHRVNEWLERFSHLPMRLFIELIPYKETRNYVKKVAKYYEIYSLLYENRLYDLGLGGDVECKEDPSFVDF